MFFSVGLLSLGIIFPTSSHIVTCTSSYIYLYYRITFPFMDTSHIIIDLLMDIWVSSILRLSWRNDVTSIYKVLCAHVFSSLGICSHMWCMRVLISPHPHWHLFTLLHWFERCVGEYNLLVVLLSVSLSANDEQLSSWLLAICVCS